MPANSRWDLIQGLKGLPMENEQLKYFREASQ
jgi:hypothetical protein